MFQDYVSGLFWIMCQDYVLFVIGLCVWIIVMDHVLFVTDIEQVLQFVTEPMPRVCQTTLNRVLVT